MEGGFIRNGKLKYQTKQKEIQEKIITNTTIKQNSLNEIMYNNLSSHPRDPPPSYQISQNYLTEQLAERSEVNLNALWFHAMMFFHDSQPATVRSRFVLNCFNHIPIQFNHCSESLEVLPIFVPFEKLNRYVNFQLLSLPFQ